MSNFIDMTGWRMSEHDVPDSRITVMKRVKKSRRGIEENGCKWT